MQPRHALGLLAWSILFPASGQVSAADPVVKAGAGSYAVVLPRGAKTPPETVYRTEDARGKMPTNDSGSSLAWLAYSERQ